MVKVKGTLPPPKRKANQKMVIKSAAARNVGEADTKL